MSPIEIQEIKNRVNAMTEEEQKLVACTLPVHILLDAVQTKYDAIADELDAFNTLVNNKNIQVKGAIQSFVHTLNEISA